MEETMIIKTTKVHTKNLLSLFKESVLEFVSSILEAVSVLRKRTWRVISPRYGQHNDNSLHP